MEHAAHEFLKGLLETQKAGIAAMLPKHITPERLFKTALVAANRTLGWRWGATATALGALEGGGQNGHPDTRPQPQHVVIVGAPVTGGQVPGRPRETRARPRASDGRLTIDKCSAADHA